MACIDYDTHIRNAHRLHAAAIDHGWRRLVAHLSRRWRLLRAVSGGRLAMLRTSFSARG